MGRGEAGRWEYEGWDEAGVCGRGGYGGRGEGGDHGEASRVVQGGREGGGSVTLNK